MNFHSNNRPFFGILFGEEAFLEVFSLKENVALIILVLVETNTLKTLRALFFHEVGAS